jgi:sugar lactone lactonase YvrE
MGIAWDSGRSFWVFNGMLGVIDRVDFHGWHPDAPGGLGGMDHSDGEYFRYKDAKVRRIAGVVSGMQVDAAEKRLYVADTGNGRIARMPTDGAIGARIGSQFDEVPMYAAAGALTDVVPSGMLMQPSGLALKNGLIYVSDRGTGILYAFDKTGGKVNWVDTGLGAGRVGSLALGPDGKLYFLDTPNNKLYRVDPK